MCWAHPLRIGEEHRIDASIHSLEGSCFVFIQFSGYVRGYARFPEEMSPSESIEAFEVFVPRSPFPIPWGSSFLISIVWREFASRFMDQASTFEAGWFDAIRHRHGNGKTGSEPEETFASPCRSARTCLVTDGRA